ncbi:MAG TPA: STAS domain-containing protein [Spirochaetia bacterium]|nr:STAS domain-containing protein [Spirochaetales bacterium]HRY80219.1 STAS domain-containing protein [Spirochaetia bacterium]HRZ89096.1 STAS domain-containing protein [Spirochaetia bacterium]
MNQLTVEEIRETGRTILQIAGPVNSYTFTDFQEKIFKAVRRSDIVVDMEKVTTLSSAGLGVLMAAMEDAEGAGRKIWILRPSEIVRLAIESTGFSDRFPVAQSMKDLA